MNVSARYEKEISKEDAEQMLERKKQEFAKLYWSNPEYYGKDAGHILKVDENGVVQMYSYNGKEYQGTFEEFKAKKYARIAETSKRLGFV